VRELLARSLTSSRSGSRHVLRRDTARLADDGTSGLDRGRTTRSEHVRVVKQDVEHVSQDGRVLDRRDVEHLGEAIARRSVTEVTATEAIRRGSDEVDAFPTLDGDVVLITDEREMRDHLPLVPAGLRLTNLGMDGHCVTPSHYVPRVFVWCGTLPMIQREHYKVVTERGESVTKA
jgi:hypothetical protein